MPPSPGRVPPATATPGGAPGSQGRALVLCWGQLQPAPEPQALLPDTPPPPPCSRRWRPGDPGTQRAQTPVPAEGPSVQLSPDPVQRGESRLGPSARMQRTLQALGSLTWSPASCRGGAPNLRPCHCALKRGPNLEPLGPPAGFGARSPSKAAGPGEPWTGFPTHSGIFVRPEVPLLEGHVARQE